MTLTNFDLQPAAIKLIVYDLDGTLVDAFEDIWVGVRFAMRMYGLPELSFATVKSYVGDGARMLIRRALGEAFAERFDEVYTTYRKFYAEHPVDKAQPYPGVLKTLERLRAMGYAQAILTNKPDEVARQTCQKLGLSARVDGIWGERPESPRKPDAEALLQVVHHFDMRPGQCAVVGDGPADHKVSRAAKTKAIGVTYGLLSRVQVLDLHPAAVIDCLPELIELLAEVNG
jgi:phosphoglycolate phosphatase